MGRQEGRPYRVLPHPVVPGEFTIVPKEVADRGPLRDHSEVVGRKSDGGPFASTYAARKALEEAGLNGTHMALVMVALMFLAKERIAGSDTHRLLSCLDIVDILRHKLPSKIQSDEDLVMTIASRHERRRKAAEPHYEKQGLTLPASFGELI